MPVYGGDKNRCEKAFCFSKDKGHRPAPAPAQAQQYQAPAEQYGDPYGAGTTGQTGSQQQQYQQQPPTQPNQQEQIYYEYNNLNNDGTPQYANPANSGQVVPGKAYMPTQGEPALSYEEYMKRLKAAETGQPLPEDRPGQRLQPWEERPEWKKDLPPSPIDHMTEGWDW